MSVLLVWSCVPPEEEISNDDIVLAEVYNRTLYLSDMEGMIPRYASPNDSSLIVNAYTERWVRENLMLYEAERNITSDLDIDKLVRDYRASLLLNNYERSIVELELDSFISDEELLVYYNDHKEHFQLETNIMRSKFMKLPNDAPMLDKVQEWWKNDTLPSMKKLMNYCEEHAVVYQLEDSIWLESDKVIGEFPKGALSSIQEGKEFKLTEGGFQYFIRVMEIQSKNSDPPMGYIRGRAIKHILHNRRLKLIEEKKEKLYQKAQRAGHVKVF